MSRAHSKITNQLSYTPNVDTELVNINASWKVLSNGRKNEAQGKMVITVD